MKIYSDYSRKMYFYFMHNIQYNEENSRIDSKKLYQFVKSSACELQ